MSELRLYTFVNFYLSQIQQGIQSAHIVSELMKDAEFNRVTTSVDPLVQEITYKDADRMVLDWAEDHKTIIVCNGGNNEGLGELMTLFRDHRNRFPWTAFHEDEQSLCGALTAVGIVLPEEIFAAEYDKENDIWFYDNDPKTYGTDDYEYWLLQNIKSKRLA